MKNKINKQQLGIEFLSVVFAVILALVLNSWRESAALNSNLERVKASLLQEAKYNDSLLTKSQAYRKDLLKRLYSNQNLVLKASISELGFDVNNNIKLADFFKRSLIFGQKQYHEDVMVMQEEDTRVLILGENVFDIKIEQDTLKLLGIANIQLKIPDLNNRSWDLAQATGTIVRMDVSLVDKLVLVNSLIETYQKTSETALNMIYNGKQQGLIPVLEDMNHLETKIINANNSLLLELN